MMKKEGGNQMSRRIKAEIFRTVVGLIATLLMVSIISMIFVKMGIVPNTPVQKPPCAVAALCIGAFIGGYVTARIAKSMGLTLGAICGFALFVVILAIGSAVGGEIGIVTLMRFLLTVTAGAFGGVIGVNKRKRRK